MKKIYLFIAFCFLFAINVLGHESSIPDYFCITYNHGTTSTKTLRFVQVGTSWGNDVPQLEYSTDGEDWTNVKFGTSIDISSGVPVFFRAGQDEKTVENSTFSKNQNNYIRIEFAFNSYAKISGNIMSLLYGSDFESKTTVPNYAFYNLFPATNSSNNTYLTDVSNLRLPATSLGEYCYAKMFSQCTKITGAPTLPAKTLNKNCYSYMFNGCTSLNSIEVGFDTWPGTTYSDPDYNATSSWLSGVASSGTFICPKKLQETYGENFIPDDWNIGHPAAITLDPEDATLCIGGTLTIKPTIESEDLQYKTITWASNNNDVATVSNDGFVNAIGVGSASITATIEDVSATCEITVQNIPASVTDLSVTPDENGALKAKISFKVPTTNILNIPLPLTTNLKAVISREGETEPITIINDVAPGQELSVYDETVTSAGFYSYKVYVTIGDANSEEVSEEQFIGFDQPTPAENFTAVDNISEGKETIHFSWEAIEGVNKGYINLDNVTYNIYAVDSKNALIEPAINDEPIVGTTTYFDYDCTDDAQQEQDFVVVATIGGQTSQSEKASAILGKAYDLPFKEEFTNANPCFTKYWTDLSSDNLSKYSDLGFDNERAMKINGYKAYGSDATPDDKQAILLSGKIQFTSADMPLLIFYSKTTGGNLTIECEDNYGVTHYLDTIQPSDSWTKRVLPFSDINADWIRLKITATLESVNGSGTQKYLWLDNIELRNIIRPESVILSQASGTLSMDDTDNQTLNLTATIAPANVDDATVTWSSSNTDVVKVNENGVVTAVGCGKAVIRATANLKGANNTAIFGECNISVTGNTSIKDMDDNDIFIQLSEGGTFNINDGEIKNISIAKTIEDVDVTYNRLFKNYAWLPWYMPFDVTLTEDLLQNFDFAQFAGAFYYTDNIKEGEMCITVQKMNLGDVVYANTPYMIRAKNPDSENAKTLEISSVTIVPTQEQVFVQLMRSATLDFNIKGIYNQYVSTADANSTLYYFTSKFTFSRITAADKSVNPFRFYMNIVPRTDNPYTQKVEEISTEIKIRTLDEDDADGIININFTDNDNVNWYDLSGRKVTNKSLPLAKGVYIYNGKKVLCK